MMAFFGAHSLLALNCSRPRCDFTLNYKIITNITCVVTSGSIPRLNRSNTISSLFFLAPICRGVNPFYTTTATMNNMRIKWLHWGEYLGNKIGVMEIIRGKNKGEQTVWIFSAIWGAHSVLVVLLLPRYCDQQFNIVCFVSCSFGLIWSVLGTHGAIKAKVQHPFLP